MTPLIFTSCLGANADFVGEAAVQYISEQLKIPTEFVSDLDWNKREHLFDEGKIHVNWMCGLLYVWKAAQQLPIELLAAPVMAGDRYQNQPIYFSDVIVHRGSPFHSFGDLAGATWAYNDLGSHSGCYLVRSHLDTLGKDADFFGKRVESGSHRSSLQQVLDHEIDASALDSTVLDWELKLNPRIQSQIRIIETLGPSPSPPWVILKSISSDLRHDLQKLLIEMFENPQGQKILKEGLLEKFSPIEDSGYDLIRQMQQKAERVLW